MEADVPGQEEGEGAGDGLLLSAVWPGGAAALQAGSLLPLSWMPVQSGNLSRTRPQPPGPSVQPERQWLTLHLFTKLGNADVLFVQRVAWRKPAAVSLRFATKNL